MAGKPAQGRLLPFAVTATGPTPDIRHCTLRAKRWVELRTQLLVIQPHLTEERAPLRTGVRRAEPRLDLHLAEAGITLRISPFEPLEGEVRFAARRARRNPMLGTIVTLRLRAALARAQGATRA